MLTLWGGRFMQCELPLPVTRSIRCNMPLGFLPLFWKVLLDLQGTFRQVRELEENGKCFVLLRRHAADMPLSIHFSVPARLENISGVSQHLLHPTEILLFRCFARYRRPLDLSQVALPLGMFSGGGTASCHRRKELQPYFWIRWQIHSDGIVLPEMEARLLKNVAQTEERKVCIHPLALHGIHWLFRASHFNLVVATAG